MNWILSAFGDEAGTRLDEQIAALQRGPIGYIDLRTIDEYNISELPVDVAKTIKDKLDQAGIKISMLGSPIGKIDIADDMQADLDKLTHLAQLADLLDCRAIRIFSYYNKNAVGRDQWAAESLARLGQLVGLAGRLGLELYLENESNLYGDNGDSMLHIAEQYRDGKIFKMIFDFDNFNRAGDDVWENWLKLRDKTDAFHLKDSTADNMHVPVGQGTSRVKEILENAVAMGWSGPLSLEPHLAHSPAVLTTHVSGKAHQTLKDLSFADSFQVGAKAAIKLLTEVGTNFS